MFTIAEHHAARIDGNELEGHVSLKPSFGQQAITGGEIAEEQNLQHGFRMLHVRQSGLVR